MMHKSIMIKTEGKKKTLKVGYGRLKRHKSNKNKGEIVKSRGKIKFFPKQRGNISFFGI